MPGFHADPVSRRTQAEYIEHSLSLVRQYLLACRADPYYGVFLSEIDYLKPYLDLFPEEKAWITRLVKQERCATGGTYNHPDETLIGGEALIRNFLIGSHFHISATGSRSPVYIAWDVPGHIPQLPQILSQCGFEALVFSRIDPTDPGRKIPGVPDLFLWRAPNGAAVYAQRIPFEQNAAEVLGEQARRFLEALQADFPALNAALFLDSGTMRVPRPTILGRCRDLAKDEPALVVTGDSATKYFSCVHTLMKSGKLELLPVSRGLTSCNAAAALTRMDLKIANRLLENALFEAEVWGAAALLHGIPYPSPALDYAWRQLLFCQHHEGISGQCTDIVFADLLDTLREALDTAIQERQSLLTKIARLAATQPEPDEEQVLLFNSLPWMREGIVRQWIDIHGPLENRILTDDFGKPVQFEIEQVTEAAGDAPAQALAVWVESDLPPTGYIKKKFTPRVEIHAPFLQESQSQTWIENDFLRLEIDPERGGGIVSLVDKESGKEFINTRHPLPANSIVALAQKEDVDPALVSPRIPDDWWDSGRVPAAIKYLEGPVTRRLLIRRNGPGPCNVIQELRIYRELPYIDCYTILEDYPGNGNEAGESGGENPQSGEFVRRDLFLAAFPLDLPGSLPVLEDRFYARVSRRGLGGLESRKDSPAPAYQPAWSSCYRWVDVSWALLVRFMNGKEEVSTLAVGPAEAVTNRGCHSTIHHKLMMHLARHGVPCAPRFDTDETGADPFHHVCSFTLGTVEENAFTNRVLERNPEAKDYYERNLKEFGYVFLAAPDDPKTPTRSRPVFIFAGKTEALLAQAVDDMIQATITHRWECPVTACFLGERERVEDFGFALLNRGTTLCGLEDDGALVMALMHTAPYPSPQTPWPFDFAEQKTHLFQYRLIPHAGEWRHADIPRRAMEYNHEPYALSAPAGEGSLRSRASFFSIEPNNILVSCIKPAGFPEAEYRTPQWKKIPVIIRVHEMHGEESNIWLEASKAVKSVRAVQIDEKPLVKKREVFREDQFIRAAAHANEILTLQLDIQGDKEVLPAALPAAGASAPLLYSARYWRQNAGSAPPGFLPVSLSLRGKIELTSYNREAAVHHLDLVLANHSSQESHKGEVEILTPPYWRVIPSRVSYMVEADSFQIIPLHILFDGPEREGFIKARLREGGILLEDLAPIGGSPDFDLAMTLRSDSFNIKLRHDCPYAVPGSIRLITPVEAWPEPAAGEFSLTSFSPRQRDFHVEPGGETVLSFALHEPPNRFGAATDHHWMIVKMESHHTLRYFHLRMDGRKSEGLGRIIIPPYAPFSGAPGEDGNPTEE
ncbi:MAG: hypothetical protein ACE15F_06170 [bacterium]